MSAADGDADGNINPFWEARDYNLNVSNVKASVFVVARPERRQRQAEQFSSGGPASRRTTCRASSGSSLEGHVDPFDYHREPAGDGGGSTPSTSWLDYWL